MSNLAPRPGALACVATALAIFSFGAGRAWAEKDPALDARDARRAEEWKIREMFRALDVRSGSRIADIGCGDGFLTVPLAAAVAPEGRVFAVDTDDGALAKLRRRIEGSGIVEVVRGDAADPRLAPASLDAAVILRAYHEFSSYREMLAATRAALKPGGRLVIADVAPGGANLDRSTQVARHVLASGIVENELVQAGFRIIRSEPSFARLNSGETAWLIAAQRPEQDR